MADPTREEMVAFLREVRLDVEVSDFAVEEAIYWFAHDYHGGQTSNLYSVLSTSEFRPGRMANGPRDTEAQDYYSYLEDEFGG